jgi:hypothetical protein
MAGEFCRGVQERMTEALLARRDADAPDLLHAESCPACAAQRDDLLAIRAGLDALPAPAPAAEVVTAARRRAIAALAVEAAPARAPLPSGYRRELLRILAAPLAALPVVLLWNWAVLAWGAELLAGLVPAALLAAVGAAYAVAAGGSVALLFGSIPFVAHGQAQQRLPEVNP